jgi:hypothetical protein
MTGAVAEETAQREQEEQRQKDHVTAADGEHQDGDDQAEKCESQVRPLRYGAIERPGWSCGQRHLGACLLL